VNLAKNTVRVGLHDEGMQLWTIGDQPFIQKRGEFLLVNRLQRRDKERLGRALGEQIRKGYGKRRRTGSGKKRTPRNSGLMWHEGKYKTKH